MFYTSFLLTSRQDRFKIKVYEYRLRSIQPKCKALSRSGQRIEGHTEVRSMPVQKAQNDSFLLVTLEIYTDWWDSKAYWEIKLNLHK